MTAIFLIERDTAVLRALVRQVDTPAELAAVGATRRQLTRILAALGEAVVPVPPPPPPVSGFIPFPPEVRVPAATLVLSGESSGGLVTATADAPVFVPEDVTSTILAKAWVDAHTAIQGHCRIEEYVSPTVVRGTVTEYFGTLAGGMPPGFWGLSS